MRFADRTEAGRRLGEQIIAAHPEWEKRGDVVVLGLPRGGVPVAAAVADRLGAELDVFCVRKLGVPYQPELAMGAVASGGVEVHNEDVLRQAGVGRGTLETVAIKERSALQEAERAYRGGRPAIPLEDRTAIVVDDGLATGASARAAVQAVRARRPAAVLVAVPVAPAGSLETLGADEAICLDAPAHFGAVGFYYRDFGQVSDDEVRRLLGAT